MPFWIPALLAAQTAGVVVVGARDVQPAVVARAQADFESRIAATPGLELVPAHVLARSIGGASGPLDAAARAEALARIDAAKKSLFDGDASKALAALRDAAEIQEKAPGVPVADRVFVGLWRVSVLLADGNQTGANDAAAEIVRLDPDHQVSLDTFAPNVKQAVDAARGRVAATLTTVTFTRVPEGVEIFLDDRAVTGARATAPAGKHWVRLRAKGMTDAAWSVVITPEASTIEARPMTIALTPEAGGKLANDGIEAAARTANVEALGVILLSRDEIRTRVWSGSALPSKNFPAKDLAAAQTWVAEKLTRKKPIASETPVPAATPTSRELEPGLTASAGPRFAFVSRSLRASAIDPVTLGLTGTGGAIDAGWRSGSLRANGELWIVSFAPTTLTADLGDVRAHAPGGTLAGLRAGGGLATFGGVTLLAAASFERYQATELPIDEHVPLFVSQTRIAPELRIAYSPLRILELGLGVAPVTFVTEDPVGTTGETPRGGLDLDWRAGVSAKWFRDWRVSARYEGAMRRTSFEGASSAEFNPPLNDATVNELYHSLTVAAARSF